MATGCHFIDKHDTVRKTRAPVMTVGSLSWVLTWSLKRDQSFERCCVSDVHTVCDSWFCFTHHHDFVSIRFFIQWQWVSSIKLTTSFRFNSVSKSLERFHLLIYFHTLKNLTQVVHQGTGGSNPHVPGTHVSDQGTWCGGLPPDVSPKIHERMPQTCGEPECSFRSFVQC